MSEVRKQMGDKPVYLSFDIDSLDPAFAPGTGKIHVFCLLARGPKWGLWYQKRGTERDPIILINYVPECSARTLPPAIEAPQLGIMSANLTVNHPNISVWATIEQNGIL